ncbi:YggS family pyridoxal phosphate-dependent enzyme [Listeria weihenstephanensis]|uniref:Pyridoxal phosphate homeostasis protein n=1 Tax=Listeria weihenstephanensis TaxID=1006155 RepID=A0A841Z567_9LIST|nr:YggS family pyridoxal phosphate-dependent enzyme [Listeria weihenstephanensis]MBC1499533.1 YggS family pyridoxal phosphate-dependent enzyme [Listeria weihenstephanensis]
MSYSENLQAVENKITNAVGKSNRQRSDVHLVAVTKTVDAPAMEKLYDLGIRHFGENRAEVFIEKVAAFADKTDIVWHFIGSLQTRKVRAILPYINYLHSLDRKSLADEIEKRATEKVACFLQVNISEEETKHGFNAEEAIAFVSTQTYEHIEIVGLMTMAPNTDDAQALHHVFQGLKALQLEIEKLGIANVPCHEVSMGMTNDFEIAVEEGATFIRVGRALVEEN